MPRLVNDTNVVGLDHGAGGQARSPCDTLVVIDF